MHPALPERVRDKAIDLYLRGHSLGQVGEAIGVSKQCIHRWLRLAKVARRPTGRHKADPMPPISELFRLHRKFGSWRDVAEVIGFNTRTIHRHINGRRK